MLISKIMRRLEDVEDVARHISLNESDPALIASTIAHIPPVPVKEMVPRKSRLKSS